jgi:NDP-sugar pyrophosphorylase family protein
MKTILICPAVRPAVAQLAEAVPLAVVPLCGETLIGFWIEHLAALGARHVYVVAADRPEAVRSAVGEGGRWGVRVELIAAHDEPAPAEALTRLRTEAAGWLSAPHDVVVMNHLPGSEALPLFESYAAWFAAAQAWIPRAVTPSRVRMREWKPGIWLGSGAKIDRRAKVHAPCWIGDHVTVEADAVVGPNAILEDRAVVDAGATVSNSIVGPDTFVGRLTVVAHSLATGNLLVNWRTDSALRVPDPFLLCSLVDLPGLLPANRITQVATSLVRVALKPLSLVGAFFSTEIAPVASNSQTDLRSKRTP